MTRCMHYCKNQLGMGSQRQCNVEGEFIGDRVGNDVGLAVGLLLGLAVGGAVGRAVREADGGGVKDRERCMPHQRNQRNPFPRQ